MRDVCVFVPGARHPPFRADAVETWFTPGRVVYIERLMERGVTLDHLFRLPFQVVYMCVRNEKLAMFHVDMLSVFDDRFHSVDLLFSPWLDDMDAASCARVGLTMRRLLADGLFKRHVRKLWLPMSEWSELFGMDAAALGQLGITQYSEYFPNVAEDLGRGGGAAARVVPSISL